MRRRGLTCAGGVVGEEGGEIWRGGSHTWTPNTLIVGVSVDLGVSANAV